MGSIYQGDVKISGGGSSSEVDVENVELITIEEIDAICGTTYQVANSEVKF